MGRTCARCEKPARSLGFCTAHYLKANRPRYTAHANKRRARQLNATPAWVDVKELERIYIERPEGMEVDHILPLQGKTVCGLHVPWNLQYLTPIQNRKKSNKLEAA